MEFRELIGKLTEAHDREVWSAGATWINLANRTFHFLGCFLILQ